MTDSKCVREGYGHWEGDFIVSRKSVSVLLVLTERLSKKTLIALLPNRNNDLVNETVVSVLSGHIVKSLTVDNDIAFTKHETLSSMLHVPVYFTRAYCSTDKALVENTNRWIRTFVPKKTDLRSVSAETIENTLMWLNDRPRRCLNWMTATEVAENCQLQV